VKTGKDKRAGTDANVFVKIFGSKGDTGTMKLMSSENSKNKFEAGRIDQFKLESTDIGKVRHVHVHGVVVSFVARGPEGRGFDSSRGISGQQLWAICVHSLAQ